MSDVLLTISEQRTVDNAFISEVHTFDLEEYNLHPAMPVNIINLRKINGFEPLMRRWHVEHLPFIFASHSLQMVMCPYCGKKVTLEASRIDHVIPYQQYARYVLLQVALSEAFKKADTFKHPIDWGMKINGLEMHAHNLTRTQKLTISDEVGFHPIDMPECNVGALLKATTNHPCNLLLCCNTCNSKKSDNMDIAAWLTMAKSEAQDARHIEKISELLEMVNEIYSDETPETFHQYIAKGTLFFTPTTVHVKRNNGSGSRVYTSHKDIGRPKKNIDEGVGDETDDDEMGFSAPRQNPNKRGAVGAVVPDYTLFIDKFVELYIYKADQKLKNLPRPGMAVTEAQLLSEQMISDGKSFINGRLCFYCLGIYEDFAFELDHIDPALKHSKSVQDYNDHTNIIPVCKGCNAAKGEKELTKKLLNSLIKKRKAKAAFGIEHAVLNRHNEADNLAYAIKKRDKLLAGKIKLEHIAGS